MDSEIVLIDDETQEIAENPPKYTLMEYYEHSKGYHTLEEAQAEVARRFKRNPYNVQPITIVEYKEIYRSRPVQAPEVIKIEL